MGDKKTLIRVKHKKKEKKKTPWFLIAKIEHATREKHKITEALFLKISRPWPRKFQTPPLFSPIQCKDSVCCISFLL